MLVAPRISECFGLLQSALVCYSLPIPHICYGCHGQCLCKLFLPGVNNSRLNTKNLLGNITVQHCVQHCLSVILQNLCEFTQCIILYAACTKHCMCDYTMCVFCTQSVMLYNLCNLYRMCCFYSQYIVLYSVCSFTQKCLFGPINHDLFYFDAKYVLSCH